MQLHNLFQLSYSNISLDFPDTSIYELEDIHTKQNLFLSYFFHQKKQDIWELIQDKENISLSNFKVFSPLRNLVKSPLITNNFLPKNIVFENIFPPLVKENSSTTSLNYLVYLNNYMLSTILETDEYKIMSFSNNFFELIRCVIENDANTLLIQDDNGYNFFEYLFLFPSYHLILQLDKSNHIQYESLNKLSNKYIKKLISSLSSHSFENGREYPLTNVAENFKRILEQRKMYKELNNNGVLLPISETSKISKF